MLTGVEIAASLRGVLASPFSMVSSHVQTLQAAQRFILGQEQRAQQLEGHVAELKKRLKEVCAASTEADDLALVARGGETIMVKASLARAASSFFAKGLDSGFQEAECKRFEFLDIDVSVLRFIAQGLHAGEAGAGLVALPAPNDKRVVEQIINFAARLLMPWLAKAAMRQALQQSRVRHIVDLLLVAMGHDSSLWRELCQAAVQRLAVVASRCNEVGKVVEAFDGLPLELLQRVLVLVNDAPWSDWNEFAVVAKGTGKVSSPASAEGHVLGVDKRGDSSVHLGLTIGKGAETTIDGDAYVGFRGEVEALSSSPMFQTRMVWGEGFGARCCNSGIFFQNKLLPDGEHNRRHYVHGDSYKLRFRVQRTKIHRQCELLLACVGTRLPPQAQAPLEPLVVSVLRLLRSDEGLADLRAILAQYMAQAFWDVRPAVWERLSCCDAEAVVSHPALWTRANGEVLVLKKVVTWALSCSRLTPSVGAEVRVRDDFKLEEWRGAECSVVKGIDPPPPGSAAAAWEVRRASDGAMLVVAAFDLLCPGHLGLEKLLQHVRFPFIQLDRIKAQLSKDELALANKSAAFLHGVQEAVDVQTGKRRAQELGERARKRARYGKDDAIPELTSASVAKAFMGLY